MKNFQEDEDNFPFILAPLIDVVLFILIFFMISYSSEDSMVQDVSLPSSQSAVKNMERDSFWLLDYRRDGVLLLDGKITSLDNLPQLLSISSNRKSLVLRADKTLSYQKVMDAMDLVKQAGVEKIYLATQK